MNKKTSIGVDCRLAGNRYGGIGRYTQEISTGLPQTSSNTNWFFYTNSQNQASKLTKRIPKKNLNSVHFKITTFKHYSWQEQLFLPRRYSQDKLDLLHVPHFNASIFHPKDSTKLVLTIHDLLWHKKKYTQESTLPWWKYHLKYQAYRLITKKNISQAELIIVPSKCTAKDLIRFFPHMDQAKIKVIKEGISTQFNQERHRISNQNLDLILTDKKKKKQLVYVGSAHPHKNLPFLIRALHDLPQYTLVIVGKKDFYMKQIISQVRKDNLEEKITFTGFLNDKEIIKVFKESQALVHPSKEEGFGLTGIEAMACGLPILASNIKIFKEIYQDVPFYFNPNHNQDLVTAIKSLPKKIRALHLKKGLKLASTYQWSDHVQQLYRLYQEILRNN